ncbi:bifunctional diguanylate cyclase/phosphodiesterase [Nocardioides sp.]|uniref:bifunctional diguanylate cyclase/phosphodiesterase n=1 Tax=Nocardioides sp. TaxID=35761 RepID=UPI00286C21AC|nr:bifunctional diguanylate cyclase/phosphodiesterase [Nocardioides sp.]
MTSLRTRIRAHPRPTWTTPGRDHLTGLPRRGHLAAAGRRMLAAAVGAELVVAVLVVDVDHLKRVNDALGHDAGDRLLVEATARLQRQLGSGALVSRLGGDEFAVLQPCADAAEAEALASDLRSCLHLPVVLGEVVVPGSASVGLAVSGRDGDTLAVLLASADQAMYADKHAPRSSHGAMRGTPARRSRRTPPGDRDLARDLAAALATPGTPALRLHHQPQVDARGGVVGYEALLRWEHPTRGLLAPSAFLPVAERHGLAAALDEAAVGRAVGEHESLATWSPGASQSVNISAHSLLAPDLPTWLAGLLGATRMPGHLLTLEVSESATSLPVTTALYDALADVGCSLSVQEFGATHASLTALSDNTLVREVKLPATLAASVERDPGAARLARGLVSAAHGLDLHVVAEGVETAGAARLLLALGCDALQGFGIAPPMALLEVADWAAYWGRARCDHPALQSGPRGADNQAVTTPRP